MNREYFVDLFRETKKIVGQELSDLESKKYKMSSVEYLEKSSYYRGKLHIANTYLKAYEAKDRKGS